MHASYDSAALLPLSWGLNFMVSSGLRLHLRFATFNSLPARNECLSTMKIISIVIVSLLLTAALGFFILGTRYPPGWKQLRPGMTAARAGQLLGMTIGGAPGGGIILVTFRQTSPLVRHELNVNFGADGRLASAKIRRIVWPFKGARWHPLWPDTSAEKQSAR